jgi:hypothetical protein
VGLKERAREQERERDVVRERKRGSETEREVREHVEEKSQKAESNGQGLYAYQLQTISNLNKLLWNHF